MNTSTLYDGKNIQKEVLWLLKNKVQSNIKTILSVICLAKVSIIYLKEGLHLEFNCIHFLSIIFIVCGALSGIKSSCSLKSFLDFFPEMQKQKRLIPIFFITKDFKTILRRVTPWGQEEADRQVLDLHMVLLLLTFPRLQLRS